MSKKKIIVLVGLLVVLFGVIFIFTTINKSINGNEIEQQIGEFSVLRKDGTKVNTSEKMNEIKVIEGLEISEIELIEKNGVSEITAKVENSTDEVVEGMEIEIIFLDKEGNTFEEIAGAIGQLEPGATTTLYASVIADVSDAYDVYMIKKEI